MTEHPGISSDLTRPAPSAPGHGPADTTDPLELASSRISNPGPEARTAGTVNAIVPAGRAPEPRTEGAETDRIEIYTATRPDGTTVTVEHNVDLGITRTTEVDEG